MKSLVTGIIPCFNSELTLERVICSLKAQSVKLHEIIVVDDGSTDDSSIIAQKQGCHVITLKMSMGRGHARMTGINHCKTPFVIFCDSSNVIEPNFVEIALRQFVNPVVSSCFGRILNHEELSDAFSDWRGKHLFGQNKSYRKEVHTVDCLITYAVLMRKDHVVEVGNFNPKLRQCEDQDLGEKLIRKNYKIVSDPQLIAYSIRKESFRSLCTRFRRWRSRHNKEKNTFSEFYITLKIAFLIFAQEDLIEKNFKCLFISFSLPFYLLLQDFFKKS